MILIFPNFPSRQQTQFTGQIYFFILEWKLIKTRLIKSLTRIIEILFKKNFLYPRQRIHNFIVHGIHGQEI